MDQDLFEMRDIRRRNLETAVWIPLRAVLRVHEEGRFGFSGFQEEFFGAGTLAVPLPARDAASELGWSDIGIGHQHQPYVHEGEFIPSDIYESNRGNFQGIHLVLDQRTNRADVGEWHLHQDLVLGLGLKREDDVWVCPDEGYIEVARLHRRNDGSPSLIEIRAEHLRDYLCARSMALYVTSYRSRRAVVEDASHISWEENPILESAEGDRWEGRVQEIHEGGHPYGQATAVIRTARTDIDAQDDVPTLGIPSDEDVVSESWTVEPEGRKLFVIQGELWRCEWVPPSDFSPRIRGDDPRPSVFFVTDAQGTRESRDTLVAAGRWLWFRPDVMMVLSHRRGGGMDWYSRDTGSIWCSPDYEVHFGVNPLGLINVYAKDIALLPEWQQRIWAAHNVGPEGGVADELLASQVRANPANTQAPEGFLISGLELLRDLSQEKLAIPLIKIHDQMPEIALRCHRFRAIDRQGLFALAKDLARLTADSFDVGALRRVQSHLKDTQLGSLNLLENLIASRAGPGKARGILGPLVGIYELRHVDAHLPSQDVVESLHLAGVDENSPLIYQGLQLMSSCVSSIYEIADELRKWESAA